jgi:predicted Zn-dependent peptidase
MKLALAIVAITACSAPKPPPVTATATATAAATATATSGIPWPSTIDWSTPPSPHAPSPFSPPPITRFVLANGLTVLAVENHRVPVVAFATIHTAAGSRADGEHPGLAALTADLLDESVGKLSSTDLAEQLERIGARLDIAIATDAATVSVTALADQLPPTLDLVASVIRHPRFATADILRVKADRIAELAVEHDRARVLAAQLFDRVVFGAHPYARAADGTAASLRTIDATLVRKFWRDAYGPSTTTLVIAGDITPTALRPLLEHAFGDWHDARPAAPIAPRSSLHLAETALPPQLAYIDVPGASQTIVMIGRRSFAAGDVRALPVEVIDTLLGGGVTSRLERRLHDQLGYTFGIAANFWRGEWGGSWSVASAFATADTVAAIRETLHVIETTRTVDAAPDELARTQQLLVRSLPQVFEADRGTVRALERLVMQHLPLDSWLTYDADITKVSAASARAAIEPLWNDLTIVVVGDWTAIGAGLTSLGLPVVHYDADGTRVR